MSEKLCECGCGKPTKIATRNVTRNGYVKGLPLRFIKNHYRSKGGWSVTSGGYMGVKQRGHLRTDARGYVLEHILIAEKAIGRPLPPKAQVHHVDGRRARNVNSNLVICENQSYHCLLHTRKRAVDAGFPATWLTCKFCKQFDDPANLYISTDRKEHYHKRCHNNHARELRNVTVKL